MPTYEYRCNACRREFEYQQKMADPDLVTCEVCGADKLEKLISWSSLRPQGKDWTKGINGKMTSEQQRDVARANVAKGAPPKLADQIAAREAHNAAIDAAEAAKAASDPATATSAPTTSEASSSDAGGSKE